MTKYLLDTNIYINFYERYYLFDFFPSFWEKIKVTINSQVVLPDIVVSEHYQDERFKKWLEENFTGVSCKYKDYVDLWSEVIQHIANHECYSDKALTNDKSWTREKIADGWLIAIAKKDNLVIVTSETKNINLNKNQPTQNPKVPDIANDLGVRCIDMNTFFKEIGLII
ncbi:DUF4411 family protein [Acinetobacter baylyi]|nr:DUF4411 family protein [Acinetobacter baylyi]ENV55377.1 hypothetical protein F952_00657 [Acinetobacter baylyi DSM 14961 = CIP 107474]KAF2371087.1 hypothetical protein BSL88_07570 [Acinetobacter baylyi]KAF2374704.1 hypothetical protein BSL67_05215 [Acinetobacter baylyi]KAF2379100.1 hypothetical protein BSN81_00970 [Acinetobacter baylyi]KAF2381837.1 hypothetical protein BSN83_05055 [Acinetobacter baylyi]